MRVAGLVAHATHKRGVHTRSARSAVAIGLATAGSQARMHTPLVQRARPGLLRARIDKCFRLTLIHMQTSQFIIYRLYDS